MPPGEENAGRYAVQWSSELRLPALSGIAALLDTVDDQAFGALVHDGPASTPKTCREWSALHAQGFQPKNNLEAQPDNGAKVRCRTLEWLQRAKPSTVSFLDSFRWDPSALEMLPAALSTALSPEEQARVAQATRKHESLKTLNPNLKSKKEGEGPFEIREKDSTILIDEQARGDFDADGVEDIVLSVTNAVNRGSYSDVRLVILTRKTPTGVLTILQSQ
jgi:hypothetical protein